MFAVQTMKQIGLLLLITAVVSAEKFLYTGYHSLVVEGITCQDDVNLVRALVDQDERLLQVILMNNDVIVGHPALLLVSPDWVETVTSAFDSANLKITVLNKDHQAALDKVGAENEVLRLRSKETRELTGEGDIDHYMTYDEIVTYIDNEARTHSYVISETIGLTFENRPIPAMSIMNAGGSAPSVYIDSGSHAREWLAIATNLWVANEIILGNTPEALYLRQSFNWYIVPLLNPDGYVYSWESVRTWRKTRTTAHDASCRGVDVNRQWATPGWNSNDSPCTDIYAGPFTFSEPETQAARGYIMDKLTNHNVVMNFNLFSYSQFVLMPTGYLSTRIPEYDDVLVVAQRTTTGIYQVHQKIFITDTLYERAQGFVYGTESDWFYAQGIPYSYTIETRPDINDPDGFVEPPSEIPLSGQEILNGIYRALEPGPPAF